MLFYLGRRMGQFDLFGPSTIFIYWNVSVLRPTDFTSTETLLRLNLYFGLFVETLLRPKLKKRSPDLQKGQSKRAEVKRSK